MAVYTYAQMMQLWIQAGGPKALAPIAAAIGEAESGGNSDALNPNDNGGTQSSFGIWQISNGTHTPPSPSWANPAVNAQLAVGKWKGAPNGGNNFTPWGTYDSGAYKAFLSPGTTPDPSVPGSPTQQATETAFQASIDCLVGNPFQASAFGFSVSAGPSCLFTRSNARAFIGAGLMVAGGLVAFDGGLFIAAGLALRAASGLLSGSSFLLPVPGRGSGSSPASSSAPTMTATQVPSSAGGSPKVIRGQVLSSSTEAVGSDAGLAAIAA